MHFIFPLYDLSFHSKFIQNNKYTLKDCISVARFARMLRGVAVKLLAYGLTVPVFKSDQRHLNFVFILFINENMNDLWNKLFEVIIKKHDISYCLVTTKDDFLSILIVVSKHSTSPFWNVFRTKIIVIYFMIYIINQFEMKS